MGGMSAQIPIKGDAQANEIAMNKVKADKLREVTLGHDGTWIAHPLINAIALKVFNDNMPGPNQVRLVCTNRMTTEFNGLLLLQYHVRREEFKVAAADLLNSNVGGSITLDGVKSNVSAALAYASGWISGNGCIPLNYLMEDAATAEIARAQLWQWCHHGARLDSGEVVTPALVDEVVAEVGPSIKTLVAGVSDKHLSVTSDYLKSQVRSAWLSDFLTSDLMYYLEMEDGVEPARQRAQL